MYYCPEKKRWRERGKEHEEVEEDDAPPPLPQAKLAESAVKDGADDGPPGPGAMPKKEVSALDAMMAPPNPYAARLANRTAPKPVQAVGAPFGMPAAAAPVVAASDPHETAAGQEDAAGDAEPSAAAGGAAGSPFAANPFGGLVQQRKNPNAPRAFGGGDREARAARRPPKPVATRGSPFPGAAANPFGGGAAFKPAEAAGEAFDDEGAQAEGEQPKLAEADADAGEAAAPVLPPTPSKLSPSLPAYSPYAPHFGGRQASGGLLQNPYAPSVQEGDGAVCGEEEGEAPAEAAAPADFEAHEAAAEATVPQYRKRTSPFGAAADQQRFEEPEPAAMEQHELQEEGEIGEEAAAEVGEPVSEPVSAEDGELEGLRQEQPPEGGDGWGEFDLGPEAPTAAEGEEIAPAEAQFDNQPESSAMDGTLDDQPAWQPETAEPQAEGAGSEEPAASEAEQQPLTQSVDAWGTACAEPEVPVQEVQEPAAADSNWGDMDFDDMPSPPVAADAAAITWGEASEVAPALEAQGNTDEVADFFDSAAADEARESGADVAHAAESAVAEAPKRAHTGTSWVDEVPAAADHWDGDDLTAAAQPLEGEGESLQPAAEEPWVMLQGQEQDESTPSRPQLAEDADVGDVAAAAPEAPKRVHTGTSWVDEGQLDTSTRVEAARLQELEAVESEVAELHGRLAEMERLREGLQRDLKAAQEKAEECQTEADALRMRNQDLEERLQQALQQPVDTSGTEELIGRVSRAEAASEAAEAALAQERADRQQSMEALLAQLEEAEKVKEAAELRAASLDERISSLEDRARSTSVSPARAQNEGEEFNLPDCIWTCGNSEVIAFVQRLAAENAMLKGPSLDVPTSPAGEGGARRLQMSEPFNAGGADYKSAVAFAKTITEHDGHQIQPLLTLLEEHMEDVKVAAQVCAALENLTFTDNDNRKTIVNASGVEAIVTFLKRHGDSDGAVLQHAVDALWNITFDDEAVDRATAAGAIACILTIMGSHPDSAGVQSGACAVLLNLAVRSENRWSIIQGGAVGFIAAAMERHVSSEEVLEQGCQALYMLAYHPDLRPHVMAGKGGEAAKLATGYMNGAGRAQKWGKWLLEVLEC